MIGWAARSAVGEGRFEVVRTLGSGTMGVVYEAIDRRSGAAVALKRLTAWSPERLRLFKNEFRALADITHPNLVGLGELFEDHGSWFFSMELLHGRDLASWAGGEGDARLTAPLAVPGAPSAAATPPTTPALDPRFLRGVLAQIARGLNALHRAGRVHRDVKPANVMVTDQARVVLVDFGLVRGWAGDADGAGTPAYMAPEQAAGGAVGPAADWYAVGALLFELLTGRLPFEGTSEQIRADKRARDAPAARALRAEAPADLDELCRELLRRDPAERPTGLAVLERVSQRTRPRTATAGAVAPAALVGRRQELSRLRAALDEAQAGHAVTVLLHGDAGIGKSALLDHFVAGLETAAPRPLVLRGRCFEREAVPYKALDEVVDAAQQHLADLPAVEREALLPADLALLAGFFPTLSALRVPASAGDVAATRARAVGALRELFARIGRASTVVVAIEDLQWIDADGLHLLRELVRPPDAPPILVLLTARSDEHTAPPASLRFDLGGDLRRVELGPLPAEERAAVPAGAAIAEVDPAALAARVAALDDATRELLAYVAIVEGPVRLDVLALATGRTAGEVRVAHDALRAADLVRPARRAGEEAVQLTHPPVGRALLEALDADRRRALHRALAAAFEVAPAVEARDARLAVHRLAAGEPAAAVEHATRAAIQAEAALAFGGAAELWALAVSAARAPPERAVLLRRLAAARASAGQGAEAGRAFLEVADGAPPGEALELRRRAAQAFLQAGRVDEAAPLLRELLAAFGARLAKTPLRALLSLVLRRALLRLRGLRFRARPEAEVPPETLARVDTSWVVARGLGVFDNIRGAQEQARHLLYALRAGEPVRVARALAVEAVFIAATGDGARAAHVSHDAVALAESTGDRYARGVAVSSSGFAALQSGRFRAGAVLFDRGLELLRAEPVSRAEQVVAQVGGCWCLAYLGELAELARRVPLHLREARERGDTTALSNLRLGPTSWPWLMADRPADAVREADDAVAAWGGGYGYQSVHCFHLLSTVQASLYRAEGALAAQQIEDGWPSLARSLFLRNQLIRVVMSHLRGVASLAAAPALPPSGRAEACARVQRIGARLEREGAPWAVPLGTSLRAGAASLEGRREDAGALFTLAALGFDEADMAIHAALAWRKVRALGDDGARARFGAQADAFLAAQRIARPGAFARLFGLDHEPP